MGTGNLAREIHRLAGLLISANITARQTMQLHLFVLDELIHGLGQRSSRHVAARANLLAIEITTHLAEGYQRQFREQIKPPVQRMLPGFDETAPANDIPWLGTPGLTNKPLRRAA